MEKNKQRKNKLIDYFNGDQMAADVWKSKYALKDEETPDDMHRRMAKEFARVQKPTPIDADVLNNVSMYGFNRDLLTEESIYNLFKDFKYIVPQGSIMSMLGNYKVGSLSNCFVIGQPHDSYGGIMYKDQEMAQLMKRRGGVGLDISTLAPKGREVNNAAGSSTGMASFMGRYSYTTREVAQNGRRGALMLTVDVRHPDVLDFVNIKKDRTQVTGANISVMLRDDFMEAVDKDEDYILRFPCDKDISKYNFDDYNYDELIKWNNEEFYTKRIRAKELYDSICENAWDNAEPGQMFVDRHWNYSPDSVYPQYKGVTTNPCGEIFMQAYDACRLMALNLFSFVKNPFTDKAELDKELLYKMAYEQQVLADSLVDLELEHISRILSKIDSDPEPDYVKKTERALWENIYKTARASRRTGSGFTALGDTLAALGLGYDSEDGKKTIEEIMRIKMEAELDATIDLAIQFGTFEGWDSKIEGSDGNRSFGNDFYRFLHTNFTKQYRKMLQFGRRNVSWSTVAPTGTVSLMTQTTSGLEPLFSAFYMRRKKVNPNDEDVRVDFTDQNGDTWMEYPVLHLKFKEWMDKTWDYNGVMFDQLSKENVQSAFENSPWYKSTANDIDWIERVEIQNIIQKYTTHSISSTINLPNEATQEEVKEIYMASYKKGLKGVTIYRDGCRTGVLVTDTKKKDEFVSHDAPKRPKDLPAEAYVTSVKGEKFNVLVGLLDGKPYEIFAFPFIGNIGKYGDITKEKKGTYSFFSDDKYIVTEKLTSNMSDEQAALTRLISTSLRHGADIMFVVEQLNKADGDITSYTKAVARILKKYIDEEKMISRASCPDCESTNIVMQEGCLTCRDCGNSKCG